MGFTTDNSEERRGSKGVWKARGAQEKRRGGGLEVGEVGEDAVVRSSLLCELVSKARTGILG